MTRIAVVGMACRYPDAASPTELWENAVAGRRAFRRLPDVRMRLADYWHPDPATPDRFYARNAAVIEGYEFDRVGYLVGGSTYRSTDLTHWLALDVAAQALADAGFPKAEGLPAERGVLPRQPVAAALAVRAAHRRGGARGPRFCQRSTRGVPRRPGVALQAAVSGR